MHCLEFWSSTDAAVYTLSCALFFLEWLTVAVQHWSASGKDFSLIAEAQIDCLCATTTLTAPAACTLALLMKSPLCRTYWSDSISWMHWTVAFIYWCTTGNSLVFAFSMHLIVANWALHLFSCVLCLEPTSTLKHLPEPIKSDLYVLSLTLFFSSLHSSVSWFAILDFHSLKYTEHSEQSSQSTHWYFSCWRLTFFILLFRERNRQVSVSVWVWLFDFNQHQQCTVSLVSFFWSKCETEMFVPLTTNLRDTLSRLTLFVEMFL